MACSGTDECMYSCTATCADGCGSKCGDACTGSCLTTCSGGCSTDGCTSNCTSNCTSVCTSTCTSTCTSNCTSTCTSYCTSYCTGCDGCSGCTGCTGCGGACSSSCTGSCSGGCSTTCTGTCKDGCSTACTGECKGACNSGCSNSTQIERYESVSAWLDASIIIDASKVNVLKAFIEFELTRRGISLDTHADAVSGQLAKGTWWDTLRINLEKSGKDVTDTSTTGNIISKNAQSEFIRIAIELYDAIVGKA